MKKDTSITTQIGTGSIYHTSTGDCGTYYHNVPWCKGHTEMTNECIMVEEKQHVCSEEVLSIEQAKYIGETLKEIRSLLGDIKGILNCSQGGSYMR